MMSSGVIEDGVELPLARPYQEELLEKAKKKNIIVYLGTGSGKTFIAVMLMKHMREQLSGKQKAVFLVTSVALLDQQAHVCSKATGLKTRSLCGSDGVDSWSPHRWKSEMDGVNIIVFIHDVFLLALSRGYLTMDNVALLVLDECHHAVGNHAYRRIMEHHYHKAKMEGGPVPRVLGLSASLVIKSVKVEKFRSEKARLEEILDAEVETFNCTQFVTSAKEQIIHFLPHVLSQDEDIVMTLLNSARQELAVVRDRAVGNIMSSQYDVSSKETSLTEIKKDCKFFCNEILGSLGWLLQDLGIGSLYVVERSLWLELQRKSQSECNEWYDFKDKRDLAGICIKYFRQVMEVVDQVVGHPTLSHVLSHCSPKIMKLVSVLQNTGLNGDMRCIVFVERKLEAQALAGLLKYLHLPGLNNVDFTYSANTGRGGLDTRDTRDTQQVLSVKRRLRNTLKNFRTGNTNVLVSTNVVEEGLDVPSCNLVIKFDFPTTFRSYIQSKGRARKAGSNYILMVETGDTKKEEDYNSWLEMYRMSMEECDGKLEGVEPGLESEQDEEEFYQTEVARISGSQAHVVINQYLQSIPVDRFTKLSPVWTLEPSLVTAQILLLTGLGLNYPMRSGFVATVKLPHKTPLHQPVTGKVCCNKDRAKDSAALQVVKYLYECGELDKRLRSTRRVTDEAKEEEEEEQVTGKDFLVSPGHKSTSGRLRRWHRQIPLTQLYLQPEGPYHLHRLSFCLKEEFSSARYRIHRPEEDSHCLGLLCSSALPKLEGISLYSPSGLLKADVTHVSLLEAVSAENIQLFECFHRYMVTTILTPSSHTHWEGGGPLVLPLLNSSPDLELCRKIQKYKSGTITLQTMRMTHSSNDPFYLDLVVFPLECMHGPSHYFIEELHPSVTASSTPMPGLSTSYFSYLQTKHGVTLLDPSQPMVRIASAKRRDFMLKKGGEPVHDGKPRTYHSYKVPELLGVEPLSAGLWKQCQILPWLLERVTGLLHTLPVCGPQHEPVLEECEDTTLVTPPHKLMQRLLTWDEPEGGASSRCGESLPGLLLHSLTLLSADDRWNMERLEILGDAFLKLAATQFVYFQGSDVNGGKCVRWNEGALTCYRSRIVSNRNLCKVAENLRLPQGAMRSCKVDVETNWLPPGYTTQGKEERLLRIEDRLVRHHGWTPGDCLLWVTKEELSSLGDTLQEEEFIGKLLVRRETKEEIQGVGNLCEYRLMSDKSCADCVEALIGAQVLHGGGWSGLQFLARVGLDFGSNSSLQSVLDLCPSSNNSVFPPHHHQHQHQHQHQQQQQQQSALCVPRTNTVEVTLSSLLARLDIQAIQDIVGYTWRDQALLLQAFTHPSYGDNRVTYSYERLEVLGDAVLDYLVTAHIICYTSADPGRITDIRSALVNNNYFAALLTDAKLDKYILHCAPGVHRKVLAYLEDRWWNQDLDSIAGNINLINECEPPELDSVEVPKVLGDIFESVIGAVYLDCNHDLATVWKIYTRLCPQLEAVVANPPLNCKKQLLERFPGKVHFLPAPVRELDRITDSVLVQVEVDTGEAVLKFRGRGNSKKLAEFAASKCALRCLQLKEADHGISQ